MTALSINVNKIALLRNSRGGDLPNLVEATKRIIQTGVKGITVHPRLDGRHIRLDDVLDLAKIPEIRSKEVEFNIEGDLRPELIDLVAYLKPTQFTVVPVVEGELTSHRGWRGYDDQEALRSFIKRFKKEVRISVFADPTFESVDLCVQAKASAVEFYTGTYAKLFTIFDENPPSPEGKGSPLEQELAALKKATEQARKSGLRVHAGHDLDLKNLPVLLSALNPAEVSIGHAFMDEALYQGLTQAAQVYRSCVEKRI